MKTKGKGLPFDFVHFIVAEQFQVSPAEVLEWDAELLEDALQIMQARGRYKPPRANPSSPFNDVEWGGIRLNEPDQRDGSRDLSRPLNV